MPDLNPAQFPAATGVENVDHILSHFAPTDAETWDDVNRNYNWNHPTWNAMRDSIAQHGVQRPIPIDYEQTPPRVMNGHTRLLLAKQTGHTTVPVRQHEGWLDPDNPPVA